MLQEFFGGVGTLRHDKTSNSIKYTVSDMNSLINVIIPHFNKYPLLTQKAADFALFVQIVNLRKTGAHLTMNGLKTIINLKASMNLGISEKLAAEFSPVNPVNRLVVETTNIPDPN
jgi:hypothetical protein